MPLVRVARFRHGESCANAGSATTDPASIQLTEKGKRQACTIGELAANPPSIIICSPYLRAKETAAPTLRRFPSTPWEIWPIQEFTYLAQDRCAGTSPAVRTRKHRVGARHEMPQCLLLSDAHLIGYATVTPAPQSARHSRVAIWMQQAPDRRQTFFSLWLM